MAFAWFTSTYPVLIHRPFSIASDATVIYLCRLKFVRMLVRWTSFWLCYFAFCCDWRMGILRTGKIASIYIAVQKIDMSPFETIWDAHWPQLTIEWLSLISITLNNSADITLTQQTWELHKLAVLRHRCNKNLFHRIVFTQSFKCIPCQFYSVTWFFCCFMQHCTCFRGMQFNKS